MSKRIGILGGISAESTIRYYDRIIKGYFERRQDYHYPEIVIFSLNFQRFTDLEDRGDKDGYVAEIMSGVRALERSGAEFVVMAANSPHGVFDEVEKRAKVPLLSIVKITAEHAARKGLRDSCCWGSSSRCRRPSTGTPAGSSGLKSLSLRANSRIVSTE
jgi:aspartate racemase